MGFLTSLGDLAGGVSKGISQEAEDRARREQAKAAKAAREEKEAQSARDETERAGIAAAYGREYKPAERKSGRPDIKADISHAAGALAKLFGKRDVDATAIASGVKPQPVLGVTMPGPPGSPSNPTPAPAPALARGRLDIPAAPTTAGLNLPPPGQPIDYSRGHLPEPEPEPAAPAAARAAPAPAPVAQGPDEPTAIPNTPPPPGFKMPEAVPVFGTEGKETRPPNAIDRQLRISQAHFDAGNFKEGIAAHDVYTNMVSDRYVRNVPNMTMGELNKSLKEVNPDRDLRATKSEEGLYTLTDYTDPKAPEVVMKDKTVGHVQDIFSGELQADPAKRALLANASDESYQKELTARQTRSTLAAQARASDATVAEKGVQTAVGQYGLDEVKRFDSDVQRFSKPYAYAFFGPDYFTFANSSAVKYRDKVMDKSKVTDPETLATDERYKNSLIERAKAEKTQLEGYAGWRTGLIQPIIKDGAMMFAVQGPNGQYVGQSANPKDAQAAVDRMLADGKYGAGVKDAAGAARAINAMRAKPKTPAAAAAPGGPKPAAAAAPGGPKPAAAPGLPAKALTPKQRADATIAKVRADQAAAKAASAQAVKDDVAATKDEDAEIKGLRTEVFELDKAASKAKGDDKFDFLRQKDPLNRRIRELERAQRVRRAKGRPVEAAPMGAF